MPLSVGVNPGGLLFHFILFAVFFVVYSFIDFRHHFSRPQDQPDAPDWITRLYFTGVVQFAVSAPGEMAPITPFGRALVWMHITASIAQALTLFSLAFA